MTTGIKTRINHGSAIWWQVYTEMLIGDSAPQFSSQNGQKPQRQIMTK